ncbi:MAG: hypothetical protein ACOCRX_04500 [Candidatus Woesearchaeota archaeon]
MAKRKQTWEELDRENKDLIQLVERKKVNEKMLASSLATVREENNNLKNINKKIKKEIARIMQGLVAREYIKERNKNREIDNWSINKKIDFTIETIKEKEREWYIQKKELTSTIADLELELSRAKHKIFEMEKYNLNEDKVNVNKSEENDKEIGESKEKIEHDKSNEEDFEKNKLDKDNKLEINEENKNKNLDNITELKNELSKEHDLLIKIIGETGVYKIPELQEKKEIAEIFQTDYALNARLNELFEQEILDVKKVALKARGFHYKTFALTEKGKELYQLNYKKEPKMSMRDWLLDQHKSLEHGILIHATALMFEEYGYNVMMKREHNKVNVPGTDSFIVFDLSVKKAGTLKRIECERGNHTYEDFGKKLNSYKKITNSFYYIVPNKKIRTIIENKFFKWVSNNGGKNKVNVIMHIMTLEDLRKGEDNWKIYDFTRNK